MSSIFDKLIYELKRTLGGSAVDEGGGRNVNEAANDFVNSTVEKTAPKFKFDLGQFGDLAKEANAAPDVELPRDNGIPEKMERVELHPPGTFPELNQPVNRIQLEYPFERTQPEKSAVPLPKPNDPPIAITATEGKPSGSSTAKSKRAAGQNAKIQAAGDEEKKDLSTGAQEQVSPSDSDSRVEELRNKQGNLERERNDQLTKALQAREGGTDQEKIALALITLLPTLIGGVAGGAIAGKAGAAAGVAGGLTGGARAGQAMDEDRRQKEETALKQANALGERSDRMDAAIEQRQQHVDQMKDSKQKQKLELELEQRREKAAMQREQLQSQTSRANAQTQAYAHLKGIEMQNDRAVALAEEKARLAVQSGELKEYQGKAQGLATKMMMSQRVLGSENPPGFLNTFSTWSGIKAALASEDVNVQKYAIATQNFLDAIARDETGAAINKDEWENYFNSYIGRFLQPGAWKYADQFRKSAITGMLRKAGPLGAKYAVESYQEAIAEPTAPGGGGSEPASQNKWDQYRVTQ